MNKDIEFFYRLFSIFWGGNYTMADSLYRGKKEANIAQEEEKERWSRLEKIEKISEI